MATGTSTSIPLTNQEPFCEPAIKVMIATPRQPLLRTLLSCLDNGDFRLATFASRRPEQLLRCLESRQPDVLLLDTAVVDRLEPGVARRITARSSATRVLLLCEQANKRLFEMTVRNRFHGFLYGEPGPGFCRKAVRAVSRGELWIPRAFLERAVVRQMTAPQIDEGIAFINAQLTERETEIVDLLSQGLTNKQIAVDLGVKEDTVKKHLRNVYSKFGIHRRTELMALRRAMPALSA